VAACSCRHKSAGSPTPTPLRVSKSDPIYQNGGNYDNGIWVQAAKTYSSDSLAASLSAASASLSQINAFGGNVTGQIATIQGAKLNQSVNSVQVSSLPQGTVNPNNPTQTAPAAPTLPSNLSPSAGDFLNDEMQLSLQIANLQLLLAGSLDDSYSSDGSPRYKTTLGFPIMISVPPGFKYQQAVAEVEISVCAPIDSDVQPNLSLLLPQEKTYNVASLVSKTSSISGGAVAQIVNVGGGFLRSSQSYYLVRDQDTLALQRPPATDVACQSGLQPGQSGLQPVTFAWQFRPVLGEQVVRNGLRQSFAQISFGDRAVDCGSRVFVRTGWRHYDSRTGRVGDPIDLFRLNMLVPGDFTFPLEPRSVLANDNGDGSLTVIAQGPYRSTPTVRIGQDVDDNTTKYFIQNSQYVKFNAPALSLAANGAFLLYSNGVQKLVYGDDRTYSCPATNHYSIKLQGTEGTQIPPTTAPKEITVIVTSPARIPLTNTANGPTKPLFSSHCSGPVRLLSTKDHDNHLAGTVLKITSTEKDSSLAFSFTVSSSTPEGEYDLELPTTVGSLVWKKKFSIESRTTPEVQAILDATPIQSTEAPQQLVPYPLDVLVDAQHIQIPQTIAPRKITVTVTSPDRVSLTNTANGPTLPLFSSDFSGPVKLLLAKDHRQSIPGTNLKIESSQKDSSLTFSFQVSSSAAPDEYDLALPTAAGTLVWMKQFKFVLAPSYQSYKMSLESIPTVSYKTLLESTNTEAPRQLELYPPGARILVAGESPKIYLGLAAGNGFGSSATALTILPGDDTREAQAKFTFKRFGSEDKGITVLSSTPANPDTNRNYHALIVQLHVAADAVGGPRDIVINGTRYTLTNTGTSDVGHVFNTFFVRGAPDIVPFDGSTSRATLYFDPDDLHAKPQPGTNPEPPNHPEVVVIGAGSSGKAYGLSDAPFYESTDDHISLIVPNNLIQTYHKFTWTKLFTADNSTPPSRYKTLSWNVPFHPVTPPGHSDFDIQIAAPTQLSSSGSSSSGDNQSFSANITVASGGTNAVGTGVLTIGNGTPQITGLSVAPGQNTATAQPGETLANVILAGAFTHFTAAAPSVQFSDGTGAVTVNAVTVNKVIDDSHLDITFTVNSPAVDHPVKAGPVDVTVRTSSSEVAVGTGLLTIGKETAYITNLNPNILPPAAAPVNIVITGVGTSFSAASQVTFSNPNSNPKVKAGVPSLPAGRPGPQMTVPVTVPLGVNPGPMNVTVTTPGDGAAPAQTAVGIGRFAAGPLVTGVDPAGLRPGETETLIVTGSSSFAAEATISSNVSGIHFGTPALVPAHANQLSVTVSVDGNVTPASAGPGSATGSSKTANTYVITGSNLQGLKILDPANTAIKPVDGATTIATFSLTDDQAKNYKAILVRRGSDEPIALTLPAAPSASSSTPKNGIDPQPKTGISPTLKNVDLTGTGMSQVVSVRFQDKPMTFTSSSDKALNLRLDKLADGTPITLANPGIDVIFVYADKSMAQYFIPVQKAGGQ
jgi:hypothetical protein